MVRPDPNAVDLAQQKMLLADDIVFWPVRERGEMIYRIEIPSQHKFYRVGYEEYVFISLLDGKTTIPQACGLAAAKLGSRAPTATQATAIQRWLLKNKLAYLPQDSPPTRSRTASDESKKKFLANLNPFWMKVPIGHSDRLLLPIVRQLRWLFSPIAVLIAMITMLAGLGTLLANWSALSESSVEIFDVSNWAWLIGIWVVLKMVHELAHAIACDRQGGEVSEFGVVFVLFAPLAYVDVTSCWRMTARWPRIVVAAAGMYIELLIAAIAMLFWVNTDSPQTQFLLYNIILMAGLSTIVFNANVLMRFDGYFILADLVDIPNLFSESTSEVKRLASRFVFGQRGKPCKFVGWRLWFLRCYGVAAVVWKVLICVTLGITAATMFAGAGIAIAAFGIVTWVGSPLKQFLKYSSQIFARDFPRFLRGCVISSALVALAIGTFCWLPIPTSVTVPAVVRFFPETLVRSATDGFVRSVHVTDSMQVKAGDLLMVLENPELKSELKTLEIALAQNEYRQRGAIGEQDASAQLVFQEIQNSLREQISQIKRKSRGLNLVAQRDGQVIGRNLQQLVGKYIREGDALMVIASESEKELVAVVHQERVEEVRAETGNEVPIRSVSYRDVHGRLDRVEPRATIRLPEPSLSATQGGPLAVRQASHDESIQDTDEVRLLEPHFPARIKLDPDTAAKLPAGMRMQASIGYRRDSIVQRVSQGIRRLWHQAKDQASQ